MTPFGAWFDQKGEPRYGYGHHPDLPWGYDLVSVGDTPGEPPLRDEHGNTWGSVREAFWVGRLGLAHAGNQITECLEFILAFLAVKDGRFVTREESANSLFHSRHHLGLLLRLILQREGLYDDSQQCLTPEGRAVLLMLAATRDVKDADEGFAQDWIAATEGLARGDARKSAAAMVEERERTAARMAHRFAIDRVNDKMTVKLIGLKVTSAIPVRSTLWSMEFPDRYARDRFYLWLLERIDQWPAWSTLAADQGARALSDHLMKLAFNDRFAGA